MNRMLGIHNASYDSSHTLRLEVCGNFGPHPTYDHGCCHISNLEQTKDHRIYSYTIEQRQRLYAATYNTIYDSGRPQDYHDPTSKREAEEELTVADAFKRFHADAPQPPQARRLIGKYVEV